jgi:hypothetical protein
MFCITMAERSCVGVVLALIIEAGAGNRRRPVICIG